MQISEYATVVIGFLLLILNIAFALFLYTGINFPITLIALIATFTAINFILYTKDKLRLQADNYHKYLLLILVVFLIISIIRHATLRFPDEYMYFYKAQDLINGNPMNPYAQDRFVLHFTYASLMSFLPLNFSSAEAISAFFAIATILPLYMLTKDLFGQRIGIYSVLLFSINPAIIFNSIRFIPVNLSLFLLTSFMFFFYRWLTASRTYYLLIALMFISMAFLVKMHALVFLAVALLYMLIYHPEKRKYVLLLIPFTPILLYKNALSLLLSQFNNFFILNLQEIGYSIYKTYYDPLYYTLPILFLFFGGIASMKDKRKLLFLLLPIIAYVLVFSTPPGRGIRHFLPVFPYMTILAAAALINTTRNYKVFSGLCTLYLIVLTVMLALAPKIPTPAFVIPESPELLVLNIAAGLIVLSIYLLRINHYSRLTLAILVIMCIVNTAYFMGFQEIYSDQSDVVGLNAAGYWLDANTPVNATVQSTTMEIEQWRRIHETANPEREYPSSTYLQYYTQRTTYGAPENKSEFLERLNNADYVVIFTHPLFIEEYAESYVNQTPQNSLAVHKEYSQSHLQYVIYKVND